MQTSLPLPLHNTQAPEGPMTSEHEVEIFKMWRTIQGEGPFAGFAAVFVRLAGCNLRCVGCDTDYTSTRQVAFVEEAVAHIQSLAQNLRLVVITGGEPFRQAGVGKLTALLVSQGYVVQIETNGVLGVPPNFPQPDPNKIQIVVSPKRGHIHKTLHPYVTALKYVVQADHVSTTDGLPTAVLDTNQEIARPWEGYEGQIIIMPYDARNADEFHKHVRASVTSCMLYGFRLGVQIHKVIGME